MKRVTLLLALFVIFCYDSYSQNEAQKWYFGYHCGLDFATNPPTVIPSPVFNSYESGASICNASGNLLFYTDANTIWNQSHSVMANGGGLLGDQSSTQSSIIFKQPGNNTLYYVFTQAAVSATNGLRYSIVDMSLAAGMGSVTAKNIPLHTPSCEKISAVKHCNGIDVWVVSHDYGTDSFRSYLVTSAGINTVAVVSNVGVNYNSADILGTLKISPNGKKIAVGRYNANTIDLFDFDASTGQVSNYLPIPGYNAYSCEFSPDGTKLYASNLTTTISQWNICAGSHQSILASVYAITSPGGASSMQLAPNGKIYISRSGTQSLAAINNPDVAGAGCSFSSAAQTIGTGTASLGLPNFLTSYFKSPPPFSFSYTQACTSATFAAPSLTAACGAASTYTGSSWIFGDPGSGASNSSPLSNATHTFSAAGMYTVKCLLHSSCGTDTISQLINVLNTPISATPNTTLCAGSTLTLHATGADLYNWSTGATTSSIIVSPASTTNYTVAGSYTNNCATNTTAIITISVSPAPALNISGTQSVCPGKAALLIASGANTYSWSTGPTSNSLSLTPSVNTVYTVSGSSLDGCISTSTVLISVLPPPSVTITGNNALCAGLASTLSASGAHSYSWSTGANTSTAQITPTAATVYTITAQDVQGCIKILTTSVNPLPLPSLSISGSTSVCAGQIALLSVSGAVTYTWSTGATTSSVNLSPAGNTIYTVTGTGSNNCINSVNVELTEKPLPLLTLYNATICAGAEVTLHAKATPSGNVTYFWQPGGITSATLLVSPQSTADYIVTAFLDDCPVTDTAHIVVETGPVILTSSDVRIEPGANTTLHVSGGMSYTWTPDIAISCKHCPDPVVSPSINMSYCVLSDNLLCISKACIQVKVGCDGNDLSLPNAFSPNGDGNNDLFCVQGWDLCIDRFSILIFSRWGEKVYESNDPSFCWDGMFKGRMLDADVVVYSIAASFTNGVRVNKKGNITLLR